MDFEDFLKKKQNRNQKMTMQSYSINYNTFASSKFDPILFLKSVHENKKFKIIFLGILFVLMMLMIGIIIIFLSLISSDFSYGNFNGISGMLEEAINFLNNLWNGK